MRLIDTELCAERFKPWNYSTYVGLSREGMCGERQPERDSMPEEHKILTSLLNVSGSVAQAPGSTFPIPRTGVV